MDKIWKHILILVYDNDNKTIINENKIVSKEVICPQYGENIVITIKYYKINYGCKNNHINNNLLFIEYKQVKKMIYLK